MLEVFLKTFLDYTADVLPYFLIASLVGAALQSVGGLRLISSRLAGSAPAPLITALMGAVVPLCSCSMIPVARTINSFSGGSYAPVVSFLVTAPTLSPVVLLLTFGVFGWEMTVLRVVSTAVFALVLAVAVHLLFAKSATVPLLQGASPDGEEGFVKRFVTLFVSTGKYVLLGLLIASLVKSFLPQDLVLSFAGSPVSYPLISLLSVPIYVCSGEEVPIARSFYDLGLKPGQALTFMLASTGVCIPTIVALVSFLPKGVVALYTLSWLVFAVSAGVLTDAVLN